MTTDSELSKLLFEAREQMDMWADVIERRFGERPAHVDSVRDRLDAYRLERGWSPHGFGGEDDTEWLLCDRCGMPVRP